MYRLKAAASPAALIDLDPLAFTRILDGPPSLLVVQSSVMQQWLKHQLARSLGLAFLPPMMMPEKAFRHLLSCLCPPSGARPEALFMDDLILLCYRELQDIRRELEAGKPESRKLAAIYEPVLSWMGFSLMPHTGTGLADDRELVRIHQADQLFTLANECAGVLFSYAQNPLTLPDAGSLEGQPEQSGSLTMLDRWESENPDFTHRAASQAGMGGTAMVLCLQAHEAWQCHLFGRLGLAKNASINAEGHQNRETSVLGLLMARAMKENWTWKGPKTRVVLFGSAFLSHQAFDFLQWLSLSPGPGLDVDHFLYLPGQDPAPSSLAASWSRLGSELLAHMKRRGVEISNNNRTEEDSSDLLRLRALCSGKDVRGSFTGDGSFRICAGPGMGREVAALKSMILEELADPGSGISCRDILVMAPDISPWRPWIEAAFGPPGGSGRLDTLGGHVTAATDQGAADPGFPLPWNMTDLKVQGNSTYLSALRMLLDLGCSRWERPEIFTLLDNRCFHSRHGWGNREREDFLRFSDRAMIRWGLEAGHRADLGGGSSDSQTWNSGFRNFCLALPLHKDTVLDERDDLAAYGQTEASGFASVFQVLHEIAARFRSWKKRSCNLDEWVKLHRGLMEEFLASPQKEDQDHAEAAMSTLNNLSNLLRPGREEMKELQLDWFTFLRFFQDQLDQVEDGLGQHLSNGITFSSLRPWRAISFPLIVVLGMNEGEFPRVDNPQAFDLGMLPGLVEHTNPGAASLMGGRPDALSQDTYAWLETLHAAGSKLWVFHHGRDPHSGKKHEPSSMIAWIQLNMSAEDRQKTELTIPIQDPGAGHDTPLPGERFRFEDRLRSDILTSRISGPPNPGVAAGGPPARDGKPLRNMSLTELARAFSHPLRAHAKFTLGLQPRGSEDRRDRGEENLSPDFLQKRGWLMDVFESLLSGTRSMDADGILAHALRENRLQPGSLTGLTRNGLKSSLHRLEEGKNQVMAASGSQAGANLEPIQEWWQPVELHDGQAWLPTAGNVQAWKTPGGQLAYLTWTDKKLESLLQGRKPNKTKITNIEKILPLVFELLPAVLAHGLGSRRHEPALIGVVSGNHSSAQEAVLCTPGPWGEELIDLVRNHLDLVLSQPFALYPSSLASFLEVSAKGESLEEAWESYRDDFEDEDQQDFRKNDFSSDRADKPGSCPYFPLVFPVMPDWTESIRSLVEDIYPTLVDMVWNSVMVKTGSADQGED